MKLQLLLLLSLIFTSVAISNAQTDSDAKNLYYGYNTNNSKPRRERRSTETSTTTTTTRTNSTTVSSTTRTRQQSQPPPRRTNGSANSSGVAPSSTGLPGTKITIELMRDGKLSFVKPSFSFKSGDKIRIRMKTNFEGYVSVLNLGSSGDVNLLYPVQGRDNYVTPTSDYQIPQGDGWIVFDNQPGTEIVSIIMSEDELTGLESLNRNSSYFTRSRTSKDLFVQTSGNDYYAVFRQQEQGKNVGFSFQLKHKK